MAEKEDQSFIDKMKSAMDDALEKLRPKGAKGKPKADDVPLGKGLAGKAKTDLKSRRRKIDEAIEDAGG